MAHGLPADDAARRMGWMEVELMNITETIQALKGAGHSGAAMLAYSEKYRQQHPDASHGDALRAMMADPSVAHPPASIPALTAEVAALRAQNAALVAASEAACAVMSIYAGDDFDEALDVLRAALQENTSHA